MRSCRARIVLPNSRDSHKRCVFDGRAIADGFDLLPARLELAVKLTATGPPGLVSFDSPTSELFRAPRWEI